MLLSHGALFLPIDLKRPAFSKAPRAVPQNGTLLADAQPLFNWVELTGLDVLRNEAMLATPLARSL
jgi:two-component system, chemotaxis family, CheB/CheR fusion protein